MKGVKGAGFGVRFYRRAGTKVTAKQAVRTDIANTVESVEALERAMSRDLNIPDIPAQQAEDTVVITDVQVSQQFDKAALRRQQAAEVKALLKQKTGPGTKELALWGAAKTGNCQRIRLLVMEGVDMDARDAQGRTAINIATQYNQQQALKTLLAAREMRRMAQRGELPKTRFFQKFLKTGTDGV